MNGPPNFCSYPDAGGAQSTGGRAFGHGCDGRLRDRSVPEAHQLLAVPRVPDHDIPRVQVPSVGRRGRVQGAHEAHHQVAERRRLRQLQVRDEKLAGRGRRIDEDLR